MSASQDIKTIHARGHASRRGYARIDTLLSNCAAANILKPTLTAIAGDTEPFAEHVVELSAPDGFQSVSHRMRRREGAGTGRRHPRPGWVR